MKPIFHFSMYNVKSNLQNMSLTLQRGTFFRTLAQRRKYNLNMSSPFSEKNECIICILARDAWASVLINYNPLLKCKYTRLYLYKNLWWLFFMSQ